MCVPMDRHDVTVMILLGAIDGDTVVSPEQTGMLELAWRCLYAETVSARVEPHPVALRKAVARMLRLLIERLEGTARRWYRWYQSIRHTSRAQQFPERYRHKQLTETAEDATHVIHQDVWDRYRAAQAAAAGGAAQPAS